MARRAALIKRLMAEIQSTVHNRMPPYWEHNIRNYTVYAILPYQSV